MSANTEKFLPPPGHHRPRRTMWRYLHVLGGAVIGLLVAACADNPAATVAGPESAAESQTGIHGPSTAADFDPGVPLAYYQRSLSYTKLTGGFTPPVQARAYGYMGLALYESVIKGMPDHQSVASQLHGIGSLPQANGTPYDWALVANAAMAEVMRGLWGDQTNMAASNTADLSALEDSLATVYSVGVPPGIAKLSNDFGRSVGAAVFATSRDDGEDRSYLSNFPASYVPPTGPGFWVPTPSTQVAMQPFWATNMTPLALSSAAQCSPGPPPAYSEDASSQFYSEAYLDYHLSKTLTAEDSVIARYWADGPGTISGPGHALAIVGEVVTQQHANLAQAAEAYARAGIANADALTGIWQAKYQYNLIRPITYIRRVIDQNWNPMLPTPPFPEYVSAHSGQSAAVATTLEALFGTNVPFVDHAHDGDGFNPRSFDRIFAAAQEAGMSRLYAGIHFQSGNLNGQALGNCVAAVVNSLSWRR